MRAVIYARYSTEHQRAASLRDLAAKSHRGMRGRVEAGKSGGGSTYGYDVVRGFNADGSSVTGERAVNQAEAAIVLRVSSSMAPACRQRRSLCR